MSLCIPHKNFARPSTYLFVCTRLLHAWLTEAEPRLRQRRDGSCRPGHSSHQKILSALRRLATGLSFDQLDDMCGISAESCRQYFAIVVETILEVFGAQCLNRHPNADEMKRITGEYENDGFVGCLGCVDCMHIKWKNCPRLWKGLYRNPKDGRVATITAEAWCDSNLYCWHWFVGRCETNNDITDMANSPLLIDLLNKERHVRLDNGYVLDGIRRQW